MLPKTYEELYYATHTLEIAISQHLLSIEQARAAWKRMITETNLIELPPFTKDKKKPQKEVK